MEDYFYIWNIKNIRLLKIIRKVLGQNQNISKRIKHSKLSNKCVNDYRDRSLIKKLWDYLKDSP